MNERPSSKVLLVFSYTLLTATRKWGAYAVAKRVEAHVGEYFETDQLDSKAVTSLDFLFEFSQGSEKKREGGH